MSDTSITTDAPAIEPSDPQPTTATPTAPEVTPNFKQAAAPKAPKGRKGTGSQPVPAAKPKAKAEKAPPKPKVAETNADGTPRTKSTVSKEGTQTCAFDGKTYPVTAFPTVRQGDGSYVRGTVTRANLEAYRAKRKAEREAAKAAAPAPSKVKAAKAAAPKAPKANKKAAG